MCKLSKLRRGCPISCPCCCFWLDVFYPIDLFERMLAQGLKPVGVTFIGVLSACSRAGFVEKGHQYLESMIKENGIYLIWIC
jgi:pentatricopeptide repeat protein